MGKRLGTDVGKFFKKIEEKLMKYGNRTELYSNEAILSSQNGRIVVVVNSLDLESNFHRPCSLIIDQQLVAHYTVTNAANTCTAVCTRY